MNPKSCKPQPNHRLPSLLDHYRNIWSRQYERCLWQKGPVSELPEGFCVIRFRVRDNHHVYATCGMATGSLNPIELHLHCPQESAQNVELLTVIAHYHQRGAPLSVGHTVSFGRPWLTDSTCTCGLVSLPYLIGQALEEFKVAGNLAMRCLWLIPITAEERAFKVAHGLEALEERFEAASLNYMNPFRRSVV